MNSHFELAELNVDVDDDDDDEEEKKSEVKRDVKMIIMI